MSNIYDEILKIPEINEIYKNYKKISPLFLHGITEEALAHISASLFYKLNKTIVIVCETDKKARYMYDNISSLDENLCMYLPSTDVNFYNIKSLEREDEIKRLELINKLVENKNLIITTSFDALRNKLTPFDIFKDKSFKIDFDTEINIDDIKKAFVELNYDYNKLVESKGEFSIRGSIIDFW